MERINTLEGRYNLRFEELSEEMVYDSKQIMLDKGLSPKYINDLLYTINTYSEFAGFKLHFKKLPLLRKIPKFLTQEQVKILLKNPNVRNRAIINLLYFCGLRAGEVCKLKLSDIDGNKIWIRDPKNKIEDYVIMNNQAQRNLQAWLNFHEGHTDYLFYSNTLPYLRYDVIRVFLYKLSKKLKFKVTAHMLRHSIATTYGREWS